MIIKTIIKLLAKELKNSKFSIQNKSDILLALKEKNIKLQFLENELKELQNRKNSELDAIKEDRVKNFIFQTVRLIFINTNQENRVLYLEDLLNFSYNLLLQELIESKNVSLIISKEQYMSIVKNYIPFVKLDAVLENFNDENNKNIEELTEYLKSPHILREDTYQIINNKVDKTKFEYVGFEVIPITTKTGFLSEYAKLQVSIKQPVNITHNFFVKFILKGSEVSSSSFIKEKFIYTTFFDMLRNIGVEKPDDFLPKCYFTSDNYIVLEDMSANYSCVKPMTNLDFDYCFLIAKRLAQMHSCSIILEEKLSKKMKTEVRIGEYFPEMVTDLQVNNDYLNDCNLKFLILLLKKFPHIVRDVTLEEFETKVTTKVKEMFNKVKTSAKYRNVVIHGDIWWNNIFYKFDENNKPVDCLLLDFQLIRYIPPAYDIIMILYITTDRKTRREIKDKIIQGYYSELKINLEEYDIDINKVLPYDELLQSIEELKIVGMYLPSMYFVHSMPIDIVTELFENTEVCYKFWTEAEYRMKYFESIWDKLLNVCRFEEIIIDLFEHCFSNL